MTRKHTAMGKKTQSHIGCVNQHKTKDPVINPKQLQDSKHQPINCVILYRLQTLAQLKFIIFLFVKLL